MSGTQDPQSAHGQDGQSRPDPNGRAVALLRRICKVYRLGTFDVHALRDVDLEINNGDYLAVMGPSGSGKSTLLNLLGCLDRPTGGQYLLDDSDVSEMDDDQLSAIRGKRLGFIFQSYNLIPQLTVLENIEVPLFYQGWDEQSSRRRAIELASLVGLHDRMGHRPTELSGGQQQRVAIARSMANDPLVILADEPTGNLDSATGLEILDMIDRLNAEGKTIIMVTHDDEVAHRAKQIIRMADGRIVETTYKE